MKTYSPLALEIGTKRRDKVAILADIVEITIDGAKKTQIMYGANLSFVQLGKYLTYMQKIKLIQIDPKRPENTYRATKKGLSLLKQFLAISDLLEEKTENCGRIGEKVRIRALDKYL